MGAGPPCRPGRPAGRIFFQRPRPTPPPGSLWRPRPLNHIKHTLKHTTRHIKHPSIQLDTPQSTLSTLKQSLKGKILKF